MAIVANVPVLFIKDGRLSMAFLSELEGSNQTGEWIKFNDIFFLTYDPATEKIKKTEAFMRRATVTSQM
ncbi:MAG: hypothetical protein QXL15_02835, partial [Candidatus Korarchaeota archaeon]